uniref:Uncharacterized protein n=1 Tax=Globodera rostochiensis TaxID=31243 RepID=A0A914GW04_GLORO
MPEFAISSCGLLLPLLLLFLFLLRPSASEDNQSPCTLPREFSAHFSPILPSQLCTCEADWTNAFCARLPSYERMAPEKAPSVCVCRQKFDVGGCVQFLTRCFRRVSTGGVQHVQHRLRREQCACCFNQPDPFCTQLDCAQMRPQFGAQANTSCHCHIPSIVDRTYPSAMCRQQSQLFTREIASLLNLAKEENRGDESDGSSSFEKSPFRPSLVSLFPSASSPLIRFFALLLIALIAFTLLAVSVCFWSHWRRRKGRRDGERRRAGDEQRHKGRGNGLLEEATV